MLKALAALGALACFAMPAHAHNIKCGEPDAIRNVVEAQSQEVALMEGAFQMEEIQGPAELYWNWTTETFTLVLIPPEGHPMAGKLCMVAWGKLKPADPRPPYQPKPEEREANEPET